MTNYKLVFESGNSRVEVPLAKGMKRSDAQMALDKVTYALINEMDICPEPGKPQITLSLRERREFWDMIEIKEL